MNSSPFLGIWFPLPKFRRSWSHSEKVKWDEKVPPNRIRNDPSKSDSKLSRRFNSLLFIAKQFVIEDPSSMLKKDEFGNALFKTNELPQSPFF